MAEIDCKEWRARCEFLEQAARNGIDEDRLRQMGIEPGSQRARMLEDGLYRAFQHCCTQYVGRIDPPAEPGRPPALGAGTLVIGPAASVLTEAEIAILLRALRFGLIGLALYVANFIARRAGYQICPLVQVRLTPFGPESFLTCNYYCGTRWYRVSVFDVGLVCPQFIVVPI